DFSTWITVYRWTISYISIEVTVASVEIKRVLAEPPACCRVIIPRSIELKACLAIILPGCKCISASVSRVGLAQDLPEAIIGDRVLEHSAIVRHVPHRPLPIRQFPVGIAPRVDSGEQLVHDLAAQIPRCQRTIRIQVRPEKKRCQDPFFPCSFPAL